jgi:limonene-1,2-epoxide hydrolase
MTAAARTPSPDWLADLFSSIDSQDTARFKGFLADDAEFRFGSAPAVVGREQIGAAVDGFFASIAGCQHDVPSTWSTGDSIVCEGEVTYRRHDGSEITLPFVNVFNMSGRLIARYKIYIDIGPLYAG